MNKLFWQVSTPYSLTRQIQVALKSGKGEIPPASPNKDEIWIWIWDQGSKPRSKIRQTCCFDTMRRPMRNRQTKIHVMYMHVQYILMRTICSVVFRLRTGLVYCFCAQQCFEDYCVCARQGYMERTLWWGNGKERGTCGGLFGHVVRAVCSCNCYATIVIRAVTKTRWHVCTVKGRAFS